MDDKASGRPDLDAVQEGAPMKNIYSIEEIEPGMWEVRGTVGKFQFYGYTKEEVIEMYQEECENKKRKKK